MPARWWIRRGGTELTVHLTDAAGMQDQVAGTSPEGHCEAIDEVTGNVYPRFIEVLATMGQLRGEAAGNDFPPIPDRAATLIAEDASRAWTLFCGTDGRAAQNAGATSGVDAIVRGSSADVLAWLHGRPLTAPLKVEGDGELLDSWNLYKRAQDTSVS